MQYPEYTLSQWFEEALRQDLRRRGLPEEFVKGDRVVPAS